MLLKIIGVKIQQDYVFLIVYLQVEYNQVISGIKHVFVSIFVQPKLELMDLIQIEECATMFV